MRFSRFISEIRHFFSLFSHFTEDKKSTFISDILLQSGCDCQYFNRQIDFYVKQKKIDFYLLSLAEKSCRRISGRRFAFRFSLCFRLPLVTAMFTLLSEVNIANVAPAIRLAQRQIASKAETITFLLIDFVIIFSPFKNFLFLFFMPGF